MFGRSVRKWYVQLAYAYTSQSITRADLTSLDSDDDLADMYLTAKLDGKPRDSSEHEEIELLLESFSKQVEEIVSEVDNLAVSDFLRLLSQVCQPVLSDC